MSERGIPAEDKKMDESLQGTAIMMESTGHQKKYISKLMVVR